MLVVEDVSKVISASFSSSHLGSPMFVTPQRQLDSDFFHSKWNSIKLGTSKSRRVSLPQIAREYLLLLHRNYRLFIPHAVVPNLKNEGTDQGNLAFIMRAMRARTIMILLRNKKDHTFHLKDATLDISEQCAGRSTVCRLNSSCNL